MESVVESAAESVVESADYHNGQIVELRISSVSAQLSWYSGGYPSSDTQVQERRIKIWNVTWPQSGYIASPCGLEPILAKKLGVIQQGEKITIEPVAL